MDGQSRHIVPNPRILLHVACCIEQLQFGPDVVAIDADRDGLIAAKHDSNPIAVGQLDGQQQVDTVRGLVFIEVDVQNPFILQSVHRLYRRTDVFTEIGRRHPHFVWVCSVQLRLLQSLSINQWISSTETPSSKI